MPGVVALRSVNELYTTTVAELRRSRRHSASACTTLTVFRSATLAFGWPSRLLTHGRWVTVSTGVPTASINYNWNRSERGSWQDVRVQVFGAEYLSATSRVIRVKGV